MRFQDKVVIVTGAAQGIGNGIALRFIAEGAHVVLADLPNADLSLIQDIIGGGVSAEFAPIDVSSKVEIDALVKDVVQKHGRIDVLVNNAGVTKSTPFLEVPEEEFDQIIAVNLKSVFLFSQAVANYMVEAGVKGAIVNLSSITALLASPTQAAYSASKGGINSLTKVAAIALAEHGIRVNAVGPGTITTRMAMAVVDSSEAARNMVYSRIPMQRLGETSEIASVVCFLASDDAGYITGQTIYADGGRLSLNFTAEVKP